jgi:hypothetical protein
MSKKNEVKVIDQNTNAQALAHLPLTLGDNERALAAYLEVDLQAPPEVLLLRIGQDAETGLRLVITMGLRILALKDKAAHGELEGLLADAGVSPREAQRVMQTAKAYAAEDDARRREQILQLGKTKGMVLLAANPQIREQLLSAPELAAEVSEATTRELQKRIRDLENEGTKEAAALRKELGDAEESLEARRLELERVVRGEGVQLLSRHIRAEAVANAGVVQAACDDLLRLWRAAVDEKATSEVDAIMRRRAVAIAVSGSMAHVASVLAAVREEFEDALPMMPGALDELTDDERAAAQASAARLQEQLQDVRQRRRSDAYEEHLLAGGAPKRGRPEGSKTKTDKTAKGGKK